MYFLSNVQFNSHSNCLPEEGRDIGQHIVGSGLLVPKRENWIGVQSTQEGRKPERPQIPNFWLFTAFIVLYTQPILN